MMNLFKLLQQRASALLQFITAPWWVEIRTTLPNCVYYFGPFERLNEAKSAQPGYLEDLQNEGAQEIVVTLKRCHPQVLTLCHDDGA